LKSYHCRLSFLIALEIPNFHPICRPYTLSLFLEFAGEGFAGARMDEIADRAGVNKATIYYHVGDTAGIETAAAAGDFTDEIER
jgi:hypothetical protein